MSKETILSFLQDKHILILGFGREGKSTYRFINKNLPNAQVAIADANPYADVNKLIQNKNTFISGENYIDIIPDYDIVIKSPGISLKNHQHLINHSRISSQTDLFLKAFGCQCIGITGTKGKSTTSSLIYHILQSLHYQALIAGNIGIPLFDTIPNINSDTHIVMELSSHQLEFIERAPAVGVFLNVFEEHLDHYTDFYAYQLAKFNIAVKQNTDNHLIYHINDPLIRQLIVNHKLNTQLAGFSLTDEQNSLCYIKDNHIFFRFDKKEERLFPIEKHFPLKGKHNLLNVCAALLAIIFSNPDTDKSKLKEAVYSFQSLPHRLEYVATIEDVSYYNDSISTIPQATIAALEAIENVNTLILGGMDRGIDYSPLKNVFTNSEVENFIFTGKAGERMMQLCDKPENKNFFFSNNYKEIVAIAKRVCRKGQNCLLSPAASSYDTFKNFEERGNRFKELVNSS